TRPAAIGVGPRVHRVPQDLEDGVHDRAPPFQVAAIGSMKRAKSDSDVVLDQVMEDAPGAADLVVLVEDQADDITDLLIGVHRDSIRGELDVAGGHAVKEFAALSLVKSATLQSISHSNQLKFADDSRQAEQEPAVGIHGIIAANLVREQRPEASTHLQKIMPLFVVSGDAAHLDSDDQTDVLHGNFGEEALKSAAHVGAARADPLVVVDDQDAI